MLPEALSRLHHPVSVLVKAAKMSARRTALRIGKALYQVRYFCFSTLKINGAMLSSTSRYFSSLDMIRPSFPYRVLRTGRLFFSRKQLFKLYRKYTTLQSCLQALFCGILQRMGFCPPECVCHRCTKYPLKRKFLAGPYKKKGGGWKVVKKTVFLCVVDFFYNPALPYREGVCYNVLGKKQKNTLLTLKPCGAFVFLGDKGR